MLNSSLFFLYFAPTLGAAFQIFGFATLGAAFGFSNSDSQSFLMGIRQAIREGSRSHLGFDQAWP